MTDRQPREARETKSRSNDEAAHRQAEELINSSQFDPITSRFDRLPPDTPMLRAERQRVIMRMQQRHGNQYVQRKIHQIQRDSDGDSSQPQSQQGPASTVSIQHQVQLIPQLTDYSCWAAGAAMIVGWRDHISINPTEIAERTGMWQQYSFGLDAQDSTVFVAFGLTPEPAQTYTVQGFAQLLQRGPLWVASAQPGPHVRVVVGMSGDGTADGTMLTINDPWPVGTGTANVQESYSTFERSQNNLARREMNVPGIYVAHA